MKHTKIAIIGLGYVGLPLAVEFGVHFPTIGFDINTGRIEELDRQEDRTLETSPEEMVQATQLSFSSDPIDLKDCNVFIVTVPTPVDDSKTPDLRPISRASEMLASMLKCGDIVIYESTVYPGCTETFCVPLLERVSGLRHNVDFFTGYSPERINPGDKKHRLTTIMKVTSGSTPEVADKIDALYSTIIEAGTFKAKSIAVAEAGKVIENTQRDVNIALMNEFAVIFNRLKIDTKDVLDAARTKWNFLPFSPGLVGGHCIGVDPYYLTYRAQQVGYHPEVILAGRRINDGMGSYVAEIFAKMMMQSKFPVVGSKILVMGLTFKEDCPDLRNSKVIDLINGLKSFNAEVEVHDPWARNEEAESTYGVQLVDIEDKATYYDGIIVAVGHKEYKAMGAVEIRKLGVKGAVLYDLKSIFPLGDADGRL